MAKTTINTAALYSALDAARQSRHLSWRALAGEIGVSPSLLSRLGNGMKPDTDGFATIVAWLRLPAEDFFEHEDGRSVDDVGEPDLMAQLAPLLRARKDLSATDIKYLQQVISATVERARAQE
uniref:transcriptional regulator n=1 Tax=Gordonia sp. B7-2 TaxID=3420932 RepID=UPI003D934105